MYIHNCSSDPHTCQRYGITGYPTLTAFRSLSWSAVHKCSSSQSTYLRLDYHGPVTVSVVIFTLELLRTNNVLLESLLQKLLHNFVNFCQNVWNVECFQILTMLHICFFCHTPLQVTSDSHSRNLMLFLSHEASRNIATPPLGWDSHPPQGYPHSMFVIPVYTLGPSYSKPD